MEEDTRFNTQHIWIILAVAFLLFFLLRIPRLGFLLMIVMGLAAALFGVYWLGRQWMRRRRERAFRKTEAGMIAERIGYCEAQIARQREELREIDQNIQDLQEEIDRPDISARNLEESRKLIRAFSTEADLRRQKIGFFELCIGKLRRLSRNQELTRSIAEKREKLEKLKENHYEDLAALEELKTELEMSATYLETIETLSLRMLESTDYDDARQLKLELEEMTRDLDAL